MDKKFLKILALSAIIVTIEGSSAWSEDSCEAQTDMTLCGANKKCKMIKGLGGKPRCFTKCSVYTKQAKQKRDSYNKEHPNNYKEGNSLYIDWCNNLNKSCKTGTWLGMFKCRNKNVPKGFSPANMEEDIF